ncbi:Wall-associated receptor kinase 2, partial [Cucurbita argyrosperma subsp. sororia]
MKHIMAFMVMIMEIAILSTALAMVASRALPGCDEQCGDVQIPYPFGIKEGCYLNQNFSITCNKTDRNGPPKAYLMQTNISVTNISTNGELHVLQPVVRTCYDQVNGSFVPKESNLSVPAMFSISGTKNKFVTIGCNTVGIIAGISKGVCMELEFPNGLTNLSLAVSGLLNFTDVRTFNPCGYAFVIEADRFRFLSRYIENFEEEVEVVLDWGIRNETRFECGSNTTRSSILDGTEYRCQCLDGYEGNPYLPQGCQDVDECEYAWLNDCEYKDKCANTKGNYTCHCPKNFHGDGREGGEGCTKNSTSSIPIIIEETVYLLDGASESSQLVGSGSMGTVGNSIKLEITLMEHGR